MKWESGSFRAGTGESVEWNFWWNGRVYHDWTEYDEYSFGGVYQAFFYLCGYLHVAHYSSGLSFDQLDSYRWIGGSHVCCDILYD